MPDFYFASLSNVFPSAAIQSLPSLFGPAERTIVDSVQWPIAAIVNGIGQKSNDKDFIDQVVKLIQDPARAPDETSWFDFDRLLFATDSDMLEPQSTEQLNNVAATLKACPAVHLTIGGYTDNTGDPAHNQTASAPRDMVINIP